MDGVFVEETALTRSFSKVPPTHYIIKIQSFSSLGVEKYECGDFEAGNYKWKVVLYPNGNKGKNVKDHISLYLSIADTTSIKFGWEVYAIFRLFLLDQNNDEFLIVQDAMGKERRFNGLKLQWGFDQFISLGNFNDGSNGYLVEDTCVFGAEVFVKERNISKGECLSVIKNRTSTKHVWRIENFSKLDSYIEEVFTAGNHKWKITLYPKGRPVTGNYLSLFLALADSNANIYAEYTMRILDQLPAPRHITSGPRVSWFNSETGGRGLSRFVELSYFNGPGNGLLLRDMCMVEAEVTVLGSLKAL